MLGASTGRNQAGAKRPSLKNGSAAPPVIAIRMKELLAWVVEQVAKFPSEHKFTVGDRLVETCLTSRAISLRRHTGATSIPSCLRPRAPWCVRARAAGAHRPLHVGDTAPLLRERE